MCRSKKLTDLKNRFSDLERKVDEFNLRMNLMLDKLRFIDAVHLRCPFIVSFITSELVLVDFSIGVVNYSLLLNISEFEELMSYALMHIDDVL